MISSRGCVGGGAFRRDLHLGTLFAWITRARLLSCKDFSVNFSLVLKEDIIREDGREDEVVRAIVDFLFEELIRDAGVAEYYVRYGTEDLHNFVIEGFYELSAGNALGDVVNLCEHAV